MWRDDSPPKKRREKRKKTKSCSRIDNTTLHRGRVAGLFHEEERVRVSERRHLPQERDDIEGTGEGEREFDFELH